MDELSIEEQTEGLAKLCIEDETFVVHLNQLDYCAAKEMRCPFRSVEVTLYGSEWCHTRQVRVCTLKEYKRNDRK